MLLALTGLISSVLNKIVEHVLGWLGRMRLEVLALGGDQFGGLGRAALWVFWSLGCICGAVALTEAINPAAKGSGIPQMKSLLAGGMPPAATAAFLSGSCLLAKVGGLVAALAGGLSIGKEGPWVHISAAVADLLCRSKHLPFRHLAEDRQGWREILSAGFAAGTAANFGAPIGGVLFSIEVTATNYTVGSYLKAFAAAISGAFVFRTVGPFFGEAYSHTPLLQAGMINENLDAHPALTHRQAELPLFVLLGVCCGLLGGAWVHFHRRVLLVARQWEAAARVDPPSADPESSLKTPLLIHLSASGF